MEFVSQYLTDEQAVAVLKVTREPGGTMLGEQIRELLLTPRNADEITADSELLLVFAARAQHIQRVIRPALARGEWVLCDRFTDASYAYQGCGRGIARARIAVLEKWLHEDLQPDLTLLFDMPVEAALQRAQNRSQKDRFESETVAFFERIRQGYLDIARRHGERVRIIDAAQSLPRVKMTTLAVLRQFLAENAA